jgi:hypothetical protein
LLISHPLVSFDVLGTLAHHVFDHITLPNLRELSVDEIDSEWLRSQFIPFLERSSLIQSFSVAIPETVDDMWNDYMVQILQHIPSLRSLCLVYGYCEEGASSFLERLSPRILDGGQVDCLIPKLNTISVQLGCQLFTPDYGALKALVLSRCSLARNTNAGDYISGPIERIWKVEVECEYEEEWDCMDDVEWHRDVSSRLAPLQKVVDTVRVVIY